MGIRPKKLLVSVVVFCWVNPIITVELLGIGIFSVMYPRFCLRIFLSPVVVCTAFFLAVLLNFGHRQGQARQRTEETQIILYVREKKKGADDERAKYYHDISYNKRIESEINIHGRRAEEANDGSVITDNTDLMPERIKGDEKITEIDSTEDEVKETVLHPALDKIAVANGNDNVDKLKVEILSSQGPGRRENLTKSVHFGGTQIVIFEAYPSDLDVDNEFEENSLTLGNMSTPSDSDDEAEVRLPATPASRSNSISDGSEEESADHFRGTVSHDDFFSLTGQASWKGFGNRNSYWDSSKTSSPVSDANSMGDLGPFLLYDHHQLHPRTSVDDIVDAEDEDDQSDSEKDESEVGLIRFSWNEDEEDENLFPPFVSSDDKDSDAQSSSEDDNLIEITLSEDHDSQMLETQIIQGCLLHPEEEYNVQGYKPDYYAKSGHGRRRKLQHNFLNMNSFIPEEDNLIEIDISVEKCLQAYEDQKRPLDLASKESPTNLIHGRKDQIVPPLTQAMELNYAKKTESTGEIMTETKNEVENIRQGYLHAQRHTRTVEPMQHYIETGEFNTSFWMEMGAGITANLPTNIAEERSEPPEIEEIRYSPLDGEKIQEYNSTAI